MVDKKYLLTSKQMASFVAHGYLRFDEAVPANLNRAIMREFEADILWSKPAGTPLSRCYSHFGLLGEMLLLPQIQGIIHSLVGSDPLFDHHYVHVREPHQSGAQYLHSDGIIDIRMDFDIQLMYFPHDITPEMGGTMIVPGTHYRRINENDIARYQNMLGQIQMVCKAGSILALHNGLWHCGRQNKSDKNRYMYKIHLNPAEPQIRLWNTDDLANYEQPEVIWGGAHHDKDDIRSILCEPEPWFDSASGRLEILNRIRKWRFISGDDSFDARYWMTRLENSPSRYQQH